MSIKPKVPYNLDDEESSDDESNNWRDLSINNPDFGASTARLPLVDIDIAQYSNPPRPAPAPAFADPTVTSGTGHRNSDDYWVLPALINVRDILGDRDRSRITTIQKDTGSFIKYNQEYHQIDIWGDPEAIAKTKQYLDGIEKNIFEKDTLSQRKSKKWGKADRELTKREQLRADRRQSKIDKQKSYYGIPAVFQKFHAVFPLPVDSIPLLRFSGENESYFNQIRADSKTYLWYEDQGNLIRLTGDDEANIKEASLRVRNWYLHCSRKPMGGTLRLMEQPTTQSLLEYISLPDGFVTFQYTEPEQERLLLERNCMLQSVDTGVPKRVDLIGFNDDFPAEEPLSDTVKTLNSRNESLIGQQLAAGLESLRLNDWVIRMKIRFGQICLVQYTKKKTPFLSIEYVSDKLFCKTGFISELAPCISKSFQGLSGLFDFLSTDSNVVEFSDNPRTSFAIKAKQYPFAPPPRIPGQRGLPRGEMWDTTLQVSFTDGGQRRLWSTITDCADLVDINVTNIESHYSWDIKLQYARRLPYDDVNLPHEKFSQGLRVSNNNRLVMVTSDDYKPKLITQKTKWQYSYKGYIIEICQDEIWDMNRVERTDFELPVDLSLVEPHRTLFKVSMYKEAWVDRFAENLDLKIGQAPSWTLRDFLASPDENTHTVMQMARNMAQILNSNVPLYWTPSGSSLV